MLPSPQKYGFVLPPGLPGEAGISTFVESPLQIAHFMQNKANFPDTQMNVSRVSTKDYEDETLGKRGKNKPNSKPIQTQTNPISEKAKMNVNYIITKGYENKSRFRAKAKQTQFKPNQTQPVVSLPALSLLVLSIVEGSKGSNLFQRQKNVVLHLFAFLLDIFSFDFYYLAFSRNTKYASRDTLHGGWQPRARLGDGSGRGIRNGFAFDKIPKTVVQCPPGGSADMLAAV